MDNESALSQICTILCQIRDLDPGLGVKFTDQAIEKYVKCSQTAGAHLICPVCFFTDGSISSLLPPRQLQRDTYRRSLRCEVCAASIPIMSSSAQRVA